MYVHTSTRSYGICITSCTLYIHFLSRLLPPPLLQSGESRVREETDGHTPAPAPHKKWQFWKSSGEKKPKKFGWITGVLVSLG